MNEVSHSAPVGPGASIAAGAALGEGCVVGPETFIGSGCVLEEGVRVDVRATLTAPDSIGASGVLLVRAGARIGAGAIVSGAAVIGRGAWVQPGAVVLSDVPPYAIVAGNPGSVIGYVAPPAVDGSTLPVAHVEAPAEPGVHELLGGATLYRFPDVIDVRGRLTFAETGEMLPFRVERFFLVHGVPSRSIRGEHAHRTLHELLIAPTGTVRVSLTDGLRRMEVMLDGPNVGLYLPPMIWSTQYAYESHSVLLVLASHRYETSSYIRDYDEFLALAES